MRERLAAAERVPLDDLEGLEAELTALRGLIAEHGDHAGDAATRIARLEAVKRAALAAKPHVEPPPMPIRIDAAGDLIFATLATPCIGKHEAGDELGFAVAAGDFDGDGFDDLAVGAPGDGYRFIGESGRVFVYQGSATGLTPWFSLVQASGAENADEFGMALAAADFDGDGRDDLAVGAPYEDVGSVAEAGYVFVFRGVPSGLAAWKGLGQSLGSDEAGDYFGYTLAAADVDGDGKAELMAGTPREDTLGATDTGYVWVHRGSAEGPVSWYGVHHQAISPATDTEHFGEALTAGDWHGDGLADLAVGSPYEGGSGAAYAFTAVAATGQLAAWLRLDQTGVGANETSDYFGRALAAGDFNGDGRDDLAVGAPGEDTAAGTSVGYVFLFRMTSTTLVPWSPLSSAELAPNRGVQGLRLAARRGRSERRRRRRPRGHPAARRERVPVPRHRRRARRVGDPATRPGSAPTRVKTGSAKRSRSATSTTTGTPISRWAHRVRSPVRRPTRAGTRSCIA